MDDMDPELLAMSKASQAIGALEDDAAKHRVIKWLSEKYNTSSFQPKNTVLDEAPDADDTNTKAGHVKSYSEFAEMYHDFGAQDDTERFLIAAYWLQTNEKQNSWYSLGVNNLLKPTGHGITHNIDRVLRNALKEKPARIIQVTRNSGTKQARRACKLTTEGINFVEARLAAK